MPDVMNRSQRSWLMSQVRSKDTKPEMIVRRLVHRLGYRYRLHVKGLPGTPDLVLASRRTVINVNGCFWHSHGCHRSSLPATRRQWWIQKFAANERRDRKNDRRLRRLGWQVVTIWECQLNDLDKLARRLQH